MIEETSPPHLAGCDAAVNVLCWPESARFQTNIAEALCHTLKHHRDSSEYAFSDHFSNMVNTCRKHVKCFIWKRKLFDENRLEAHYQHYHPISMNEGLWPDGIAPPAGWDRPEPSWFDISRCTWIAIDERGRLIHLPIDNVPGEPPPEDTPDRETIDPQKPDLTWTPDETQTRAHRQVVGVENVAGKAYGIATGFYNKHRKNSEQSNPWHPFHSAPNIQQAQSFSQLSKTWIDQHLRHGLDNCNIESYQSAGALRKFLSRLNFGLGNDSWIEDQSHIFRTLYFKDIFYWVHFLLAHHPFQADLDCGPVWLAYSESHRISSEMYKVDWWWDMLGQLPARATIVPVICASGKTHLTNSSGDQHAWPLYVTIGNIPNDICRTPQSHPWILVVLIPYPLNGATNTDKAWDSAVWTVQSPLRNLDITGPGLKWDCAAGFQRQCYPLLAAWVGDYADKVIVAQFS